MKKLVSLLLVVALSVSCITCAFADSAVSQYNERLKGTWSCSSFCGVSKNNSPSFYFLSLEKLKYPEGGSATEVPSVGSYSFILTGDDTGEVYLICSTKTATTAARVYLSADDKTMLLITTDGAQFIFKKEN